MQEAGRSGARSADRRRDAAAAQRRSGAAHVAVVRRSHGQARRGTWRNARRPGPASRRRPSTLALPKTPGPWLRGRTRAGRRTRRPRCTAAIVAAPATIPTSSSRPTRPRPNPAYFTIDDSARPRARPLHRRARGRRAEIAGRARGRRGDAAAAADHRVGRVSPRRDRRHDRSTGHRARTHASRCSATHGMLLAPPMNAVAYRARKDQLVGCAVRAGRSRDAIRCKAASEARAWKDCSRPASTRSRFRSTSRRPSATRRGARARRGRARGESRPALRGHRRAAHRVRRHDRSLHPADAEAHRHLSALDVQRRVAACGLDGRRRAATGHAHVGMDRVALQDRDLVRVGRAVLARSLQPPRSASDASSHARANATSFDDGDDIGNLDGVLAYPAPTGVTRRCGSKRCAAAWRIARCSISRRRAIRIATAAARDRR